MKNLLEFLNSYGIYISIDSTTSPFILFIVCIFVLSFIGLLSLINIIIYLIIIYKIDENSILNKIQNGRIKNIISKIFNLYKKTRTAFLYFETMLLITSLSSITYLCFYVLSGIANLKF